MITPKAERKPYRDTDDEPAAPSSGPCPLCDDRDPDRRHRHYLAIAKQQDVEGLRAHLSTEYVHRREAGKKRQDVVDSICTWVLHLIDQYSHSRLVDERTGADLTWWQVRDHMAKTKIEMAEACYQQAPEAFRKHPPVYEVSGFSRVEVRSLQATPRMREPGEEEMDDWPEEQGEAPEVDPDIYRDEEAS